MFDQLTRDVESHLGPGGGTVSHLQHSAVVHQL